ncbi:MAG: hypothetical protein OXU36_16095 [Candidatus Poribacteria bacterium]|nr:hypothetical protein [Candidatus Poribacteria bacterium]
MRASRFLGVYFSILLIGFVLNLTSCGGSNSNNPVSDANIAEDTETSDTIVELAQNQDTEKLERITDLEVTITVTKKTVQPGEEAELTASVKGVRGTSVTLNWLNITGLGQLSPVSDNEVTWTAPATLNGEAVQVEVIQLVVTVISEVVSVGTSGIDTDTQIFSETQTVLLTVKE